MVFKFSLFGNQRNKHLFLLWDNGANRWFGLSLHYALHYVLSIFCRVGIGEHTHGTADERMAADAADRPRSRGESVIGLAGLIMSAWFALWFYRRLVFNWLLAFAQPLTINNDWVGWHSAYSKGGRCLLYCCLPCCPFSTVYVDRWTIPPRFLPSFYISL